MSTPKKLNFAKYLRRNQTSAETLLWQELRNRRCGGYKFRRQVPIDKFIVDFFCASQKLIIELDGPTHEGREDYDEDRTRVLESLGYHIIRFKNDDCYEDIDATTEAIWHALEDIKA